MFEFLHEREPIGQRGTFIYGIDDAAIAAAAEAAKIAAAEAAAAAAAEAAAAAGTSAASAATTGAGGLAAESAPLLAEAPAALPQSSMGLDQALTPLDSRGMNMMPPPSGGAEPPAQSGIGDPTSSLENLSEGNLTQEVMAPMQTLGNSMPSMVDSVENVWQGKLGDELGNVGKNPMSGGAMPGMGGEDMSNPMSMFAGDSDEPPPMPAPQPLPERPKAPPAPSTPGVPMSMQDKFQGAHMALRMASKLIPNKQARQTLDLMSVGTGLASSGGDMSKSSQMVMEPLNDLASITQQQEKPRLDQALSPLSAPSTRAPTPAPAVSSNSATARGTGTLPPTRLVGDREMQPNQRRLSSYFG